MSTFTATTTEQARLLHDSSYSRLLAPLVHEELGAAQLAKMTGLDVKATHHRLTRLHHAGLIIVSAEQRRAGRAVKLYRALAQEFNVPFHLTSADTFAQFIAEIHRERLQKHFEVTGELVTRHSQGLFSYTPYGKGSLLGTVKDLGSEKKTGWEVALSTYYRHSLTHEQAREVEKRLTELTNWLEEKSRENGSAGTPYLLGLMFSPEKLT